MSAPITNKPSCCCPTDLPPVKSDYTGKGTFSDINGVNVYTVGSGELTVLFIYDIFGMHGNTLAFADGFSQYLKCRVVMPDVFRGNPWPESKYPVENREELVDWVLENGSDEIVLDMVDRIREHLMLGTKYLAMVGQCFGAAKVFRMAPDTRFCAAISYHPSFLTTELASKVNVPSLVINTKEDPENLHIRDAMLEAASDELREKHIWEHWHDIHHGFTSSRGDFGNEHQRKRAMDAIVMTAEFIQKNLKPMFDGQTEISSAKQVLNFSGTTVDGEELEA